MTCDAVIARNNALDSAARKISARWLARAFNDGPWPAAQ